MIGGVGISIARMPINAIKFMQDNTELELIIQDDITPKEAAQLAILFAVAAGSTQTMVLWDYIGYIKSNNLTRHFKEKPCQKN